MPRMLIAGYQHETNTFAPSLADWAGAIASIFVTNEAFERIADTNGADVRAAAAGGLDGIYLDLHGAAVAQQAAASEGELRGRLRAIVGPGLPIITRLDLHAIATLRMLGEADALMRDRTDLHVDRVATGELAAEPMVRRLKAGRREPLHAHRLPCLTPLNAQSTWMQPAQGLDDGLLALDKRVGTVLSVCMGFRPATSTHARRWSGALVSRSKRRPRPSTPRGLSCGARRPCLRPGLAPSTCPT